VTQDAAGRAPRFTRGLAVALLVIGLVVVLLLLVAAPLFVTANPAFFTRYRALNRRYASLQTSVHRGLACNECHGDSRGPAVYTAGLMADFYASLFSKQREPAFVKFEKPSREACVKCHRGAWSFILARTTKVPHPAHLRVSTEKRDCVTCHKWTAHEEAYMQKHKTMPFSGVCVTFGCHVGYKPADQCELCHHTIKPDKAAWTRAHPEAVRSIGANACLEKCHDAWQCTLCHTTGKTPVFTGLKAQSGTAAIEVLHAKPDWLLKQHGPQALADKSKCQICHISEGECQDCHALRPAFHGSTRTWLARHKEPGKNQARCLACHTSSWCKKCHDQFKEK